MSTLSYILLFTFLGSVGALVGGALLLAKAEFSRKLSHYLTAFAAGILLASAFGDLLPEALAEETWSQETVLLWALAGLLIFFLTEQTIHWFHRHEESYHETDKGTATVPLIIVGDTIHNFIDGVVIAATFLVSAPLGIITTFAVAAHEIPQEIADFSILLHKGLSAKRVLVVNLVSSLAAFAGALGTYALGSSLERYVPVFLALTAGFFIYIATSDIIPEIHYEKRGKAAALKSSLLVLGVIVLSLLLLTIEGLE